MNWMTPPLKPASLAALLLLLGSGSTSADEVSPATQAATPTVHSAQSGALQPAVESGVIRVAWDRVGTMA